MEPKRGERTLISAMRDLVRQNPDCKWDPDGILLQKEFPNLKPATFSNYKSAIKKEMARNQDNSKKMDSNEEKSNKRLVEMQKLLKQLEDNETERSKIKEKIQELASNL